MFKYSQLGDLERRKIEQLATFRLSLDRNRFSNAVHSQLNADFDRKFNNLIEELNIPKDSLMRIVKSAIKLITDNDSLHLTLEAEAREIQNKQAIQLESFRKFCTIFYAVDESIFDSPNWNDPSIWYASSLVSDLSYYRIQQNEAENVDIKQERSKVILPSHAGRELVIYGGLIDDNIININFPSEYNSFVVATDHVVAQVINCK